MLPSLAQTPVAEVARQDLLQILRKIEYRKAFSTAEKCRTWFNQLFKDKRPLHHTLCGLDDEVDTTGGDGMDVIQFESIHNHSAYALIEEELRVAGKSRPSLTA